MFRVFRISPLLALGLGTVVGSVLGLLAAPAMGSETRDRLRRRFDEESESLLRRGQRAAEHAADYLERRLA